MGARAVSLVGTLIWIAAVVSLASSAVAGTGGSRTKITVYAAAPASTSELGGLTYGGHAPISGAVIVDERQVELAVDGELRVDGVAATLDPASVQLRDRTDPNTTITEQRFVRGATTPTELLQRHVGAQVTVMTPNGELTGVLRAADDDVLVLEAGGGASRRVHVLRRDGYVQDVRLPAGPAVDAAALVWRVAPRSPGPHAIELTYRATGMTWDANYLAVLGDDGQTVDFSARATVRNTSGATFDRAALTLVSAGNAGSTRYTLPSPVRLGDGQAVQLELIPTRRAAKTRPVITYEMLPDPSAAPSAPNTDCNQLRDAGAGRAEVTLELDVPGPGALPEGRVRTYRRQADRLEIVSEEPLRPGPGVARIWLSDAAEITGERRVVACNHDERARTLTEKLQLTIENRSKRATEVAIREHAWRWPMWKLVAEDTPSMRADAQTLEYRVKVPAGGRRTVTYEVGYSW